MKTNCEIQIRPLVFTICLLFSFYTSFSQSKEKEIIAFNAGAGVLTFHGDVGSNSLVGSYSFIRRGIYFSGEKYFSKNFSLSLNLLKGKIARDELASDNLPKLNFESPITQIGLSATYLMAGKSEHRDSYRDVIPFLSAGISFLAFDPHGDLKDSYGNSYYYWGDGSIKNLPESGANFFYAKNINRDYKYETKLTDSVSYSRSAICLPLSTGIKLKLTKEIDANLAFTYNIAFSDYLDNVKSGSSDAFLFSSVTLTYHFIALPKKEREQVSQLYVEMDKMDLDKDGVADADDFCPGTPKEIKVDGKGCPLDGDADGVPDFLDKEPHSKNGLPVDINGVELTKARMAQIQKQHDGAAELHSRALSESFNKKPSASFMKEVEEMQKELRKNPDAKTSAAKIPYDLRVADWNKDGFISSDEIAKTIDAFFDGSITINAEQIHRLIDFFFEQ